MRQWLVNSSLETLLNSKQPCKKSMFVIERKHYSIYSKAKFVQDNLIANPQLIMLMIFRGIQNIKSSQLSFLHSSLYWNYLVRCMIHLFKAKGFGVSIYFLLSSWVQKVLKQENSRIEKKNTFSKKSSFFEKNPQRGTGFSDMDDGMWLVSTFFKIEYWNF